MGGGELIRRSVSWIKDWLLRSSLKCTWLCVLFREQRASKYFTWDSMKEIDRWD